MVVSILCVDCTFLLRALVLEGLDLVQRGCHVLKSHQLLKARELTLSVDTSPREILQMVRVPVPLCIGEGVTIATHLRPYPIPPHLEVFSLKSTLPYPEVILCSV